MLNETPATAGVMASTRLRAFVGCAPPTPCAPAGAAIVTIVLTTSAPARSRATPVDRANRMGRMLAPGCAPAPIARIGLVTEDAVSDEIEGYECHRDRGHRAEHASTSSVRRPGPDADDQRDRGERERGAAER